MTDQPIRLYVHAPDGEHDLLINSPEDRAAPLTDILRRHGLPLNTRCGGHGICEGCLVNLSRAGAPAAEVKACEQTVGSTDLTVHIPPRSWNSFKPAVLDEYRINVPFAHQPLVDCTNQRALGLAVDIGTTTVAVMLVDLHAGASLAKATAFNRQLHLGDDVLTRINLCRIDPFMVGKLQHELVVGTFEPLIEQVLQTAHAERRQLAVMTAAGNTTMLHLLAGVDPSSMGHVPFTPQFLDHRTVDWRSVGLAWNDTDGPPPVLHLLPGAAAYVGADLTGGLLASGLLYDDGPSLLVDIGTNGEIIFKRGDTLLGCATAAGPAFEGGGLRAGVRAGLGAVSHINFDLDPPAIRFDVIGDADPIGLCGSAYIDLLARGVACGLIDRFGHFTDVLGRRVQNEAGRSQRLHLGHSLYVSEAEIARLLQAKAAIAAGVLTLLDRENIRPHDVKRLYLAGGFGMHVDLTSALGCGLLPGFTLEQIELVGNTSLAGAFMAMMDRDLLPVMADAAARMDVLELNREPGFEDHFIDQLALHP